MNKIKLHEVSSIKDQIYWDLSISDTFHDLYDEVADHINKSIGAYMKSLELLHNFKFKDPETVQKYLLVKLFEKGTKYIKKYNMENM